LDLGISQKSLRVRLKEGKEKKVINSFMSRLRGGEQESKGDFLTVRIRKQQLGTHSNAAFQRDRTVELAHNERQTLGTIF